MAPQLHGSLGVFPSHHLTTHGATIAPCIGSQTSTATALCSAIRVERISKICGASGTVFWSFKTRRGWPYHTSPRDTNERQEH